jgi:hypothetical protein
VHGKDPAKELEESGESELVHKYEYLAESLANATAKWAMKRHTYLRTMTRADLEAAWDAGSVPI